MTMSNGTSFDLPPLPQRVISERLIIRPSVRADAPYLQKWWNDPDVMEPGGNVDGMQYDDTDIEQWFQRYVDCRSCANHFVICLRQPVEQPIGEFYIACDDRPGCVDFAILIGETDQWGNGYGGEAINAYAEALFASGYCEAMRVNSRRDNTRAISLFESVGFEVEYVWANEQFQTMILTQAAFELRRLAAQDASQAK
jgi:RimJ/RimL family protein N-acetyltransferase